MDYEIDYLFTELTSGSGVDYLTVDTLHKGLKAANVHMDRKEVERFVKENDQNGDGKIDKQEFRAFMGDIMKRELIEQQDSIIEITNMFHDADINKDGLLQFDELYNLFNKIDSNIT